MSTKVEGAGGDAAVMSGAPPPMSPMERVRASVANIDYFSLWPLALMLLIIVFTSFRSSQFLTPDNFKNIVTQSAVLGIVTMGQTILLVSAGLDLSVAANVSFAGVVTGLLFTNGLHVSFLGIHVNMQPWPLPGAILAGITAAACVGLVNGLLVSQNRAHPFIITLGTGTFLLGLSTEMTGSAPVNNMGGLFTTFSGYLPDIPPFFGMPWPAFMLLVMVAITFAFLRWTPLGRRAYAIGGNEEVAYLSGIPVKRTKIYLYVIMGLFAGIAGMLLSGILDAAEFNLGQNLELQSIAAAVIGGTALFGGRGGALRSLMGVFLMGLVTNSLNFLGLSSNYQTMALGAIIVLAVMVQRVQR